VPVPPTTVPEEEKKEEPVKVPIEKREYTMIDYLRSGWQLNFMFAIDFTGSNGAQSDGISLHDTRTNN
jgi:hypothetical protein